MINRFEYSKRIIKDLQKGLIREPMNQAEVSRFLNVSASYISLVANGKSSLTIDHLIMLGILK